MTISGTGNQTFAKDDDILMHETPMIVDIDQNNVDHASENITHGDDSGTKVSSDTNNSEKGMGAQFCPPFGLLTNCHSHGHRCSKAKTGV